MSNRPKYKHLAISPALHRQIRIIAAVLGKPATVVLEEAISLLIKEYEIRDVPE